MTDLQQVQIDLEQEQYDLGIARYRNNVDKAKQKGQLNAVEPVKILHDKAITPMIKYLQSLRDQAKAGKAGRKSTIHALLEQVDLDVVAVLTARATLSCLLESGQAKVLGIESKITASLNDHVHFSKFKKAEPKLVKYVQNKQHTQHERHKRNAMRSYANWVGIEKTEGFSLKVGITLLEIFIEATGVVEKFSLREKGKTKQFVRGVDEVLKFIEERHERNEIMQPMLMPMVVKPLPWTGVYDGGYFNTRFPLIKTRNKQYLAELENTEMPKVYRALNAVQETGWCINQNILTVAREIWTTESHSKVLPSPCELELPPLPFEPYKGMSDAEKEVFNNWKFETAKVHTQRIKDASKRSAVIQKLDLADKFKDFDAVYFPHNYDTRGRMYPLANVLNPQSDDLGKSLLMLAEGERMGTDGEHWLMVHIANTFGVDKVSNEERVQWTKAHELQIAMTVANPYDSSWWRDADSPWQFLAACVEWEIYKQSGEGENFITQLVINMDGTCNGLQHYSAMLRDEIGGKATNLVPSDTPADIYTEVLDVLRTKLEADGGDMAKTWMPHLERKLVKPQVMTTPYGVSAYGMREQLSTFMNDKRSKHDGSFDPLLSLNDLKSRQEYEAYLTPLIQASINEVVVASNRAMAWLKDCAKATNKCGYQIRWNTPAGLPVVQSYRKMEVKRIDILVETLKVKHSRLSRQVQNETDKLDTAKQLAGIAPNFVHSLDASHLMLTVNKCVDVGIKSFSMIHDSYGTTAGSVTALQDALRTTFAEMYEVDVLNEFRESIMEQTHKFIEPVPPRGTLDINQVVHSQYFFA